MTVSQAPDRPEDIARALERSEQRWAELNGASLRSQSGDAELHFRGLRIYRGGRRLPIPAPHLALSRGELDSDPGTALHAARSRQLRLALRGVGDASALRLQHTDPRLHRAGRPANPLEALVFDLLEQLRVEALVPAALPGQQANVRQRFVAWSEEFQHSGLLEYSLGHLVFAVSQICWSRLNAESLSDEASDRIEGVRASLVPVIGIALDGMRRHRQDQGEYARHAREVAAAVHAFFRKERQEEDEEASPAQDDDPTLLALAALLGLEPPVDETPSAEAGHGDGRSFQASGEPYRVFTRRYDQEVRAAELARAEELVQFRERLDQRVAEQDQSATSLARRLLVLLGLPQTDNWNFGEDSGRLDGRRLSQLVVSPADQRVFKRERIQPRPDCAISVLIDCSGSMKAHIERLAVLIDLLSRALDLIGVDNEVLGFSTAAWNGGRARRDWLAAGRPANPGRLNEVSHRIFKSADRRWRQARNSIAALLKVELFREGVDAEAVEWACARLATRDVSRRVLMVITDGCPMDGATREANSHHYLDDHLLQVVSAHERIRDVEICGLGVGLDLSPYYRRNASIDVERAIDGPVVNEVLQLLARAWSGRR